jgi:glucose-1-phosphate thymidylyltransferase
MENKLKLYGFNNLTKSLSFNIYDVCYAKTAREQRDYISYIDEQYNSERLTNILYKVTEIIGAQVLYEVPDALQAMIRDGARVVPVRAVDWQDAVNPWDLLEMNAKLLPRIEARRAGTISRSSKLYGLIQIGKGTVIGPNTYIHGPVVIGEDCAIGPNCVIMPNTSIGSRVTIDPLSYVAHSLVMDDVVIGSHSRIIDAVVGEACRLQDHTDTWMTGAVLEREGRFQKAAFGAVLGDRVSSAPFTILKNCIIGNNVTIEAGNTTVTGVVPDGAVVI